MKVSSNVRTTLCATFGSLFSNDTTNVFCVPGPVGRPSWISRASESMTASCSRRVFAFSSRSVFCATFSRFGRLSITACIIATWLNTSRLTARPVSNGFSSDSVST